MRASAVAGPAVDTPTSHARRDNPRSAKAQVGDRIDVSDANGNRIGWVNPQTGVRNLLVPELKAEFDQMIDYWLAAAGLTDPRATTNAATTPAEHQVDEATQSLPIAPLPALGTQGQPNSPPPPLESSPDMSVTEVRFPDAEVVRSLVIPLLRLT